LQGKKALEPGPYRTKTFFQSGKIGFKFKKKGKRELAGGRGNLWDIRGREHMQGLLLDKRIG